MECVRYDTRGPPSVLSLNSVPIPKADKPGQVLIKVHYAGVNPVDTHLRGTHHPRLTVDLPATPGKDAAGTVENVGPEVTQFKVGDRVFVSNHSFRSGGTYAPYHLAHEDEVHHLPESYTLQEGASLGSPYFTAIRALFIAAKAKKGESLLIHGASGAVGTACVQLGIAHGLKVYGTAGTEGGIQRLKTAGVAGVYNHRATGYIENIKQEFGVRGVNIIIEMAAGHNLQKDIELLSRKGRIVIVGGTGSVSITPALILAKEAIVTGVKLADSTKEEWSEMSKVLTDGLKAGYLRPTLHKEYPLREAEKAHHDLENTDGSQGKLLLKVI
ncbi:quinone oxidoreductase-like [Paramacrobiotus metropolitanus]|uniref:quinone oxidoreductase-like n=1 Tax=Paramacrobiotus metropolitanus TaxID=2943436 RepID=UPI00244570F9|nr:quinone oxidoreductase-like [Paramacrobiotus metropolitanus]XP_055339522.1 quinone oxidoreductase-like [Paramacrobiotus metropolitanus]XP_055339523.1 quinone oxidoreductase-like [Paramacrobiotus metropolitanus]XP_055339524.1 quinone oxidoreductase-like [Paramacrobiotus metropolitanus]